VSSQPDILTRCGWVAARPPDDPMLAYHDEEWGVPLHDDRALFELLTLEGAQAGLSWDTILRRRDSYRRAFEGFDIERIARYGQPEVERLLQDAGIIRNRAKINATIANALATLEVQREFGSLDAYMWAFVNGKAKLNAFERLSDLPAQTAESLAMSKDLARRGFRFVGPTICYAFMESAGLVNDHQVDCFRYPQVGKS
jgi:DNA-3-methyladenine glycosylase I